MIEIFIIFLCLASFFLALGVFKKQYIFIIVSALLFFVCSYLVAAGIQYVSSYSISGNTVTKVFAVWDDPLIKIPIAAMLLLIGLFLIMIAWLKILERPSMAGSFGEDED